MIRVSGGEAASQLCDVPELPRDTVFLIREITRKLVHNSEMCRGSLAIRWGSEGFV